MAYSRKQIEKAKKVITNEIEKMTSYDYGKIVINMNTQAGNIEIVPQPHIRVKKEKLDRDTINVQKRDYY